ncbi:hypothetical protein OPV22_002242 [Ensete ventricosum]|uniref:Secreted protein n=1 Tax=Ensete ventricosum TaxID=4639 RepID=A0AAV8RXD9_ENSVE|nr:hypothetical protein OPV22_002242 [Ensete ventricosum]
MRIPILFLAAVLVYLGRLVLRCPTWLLRVAKAVTTNIRLPAPITSQGGARDPLKLCLSSPVSRHTLLWVGLTTTRAGTLLSSQRKRKSDGEG